MRDKRKMVGAGMGATLGGAIAVIVLWIVRILLPEGTTIPAEVEQAITVLASAIISMVMTYWFPANEPK